MIEYSHHSPSSLDAKAIICQMHYTRSWPSGKSFIFTHEDAIVVFSIPANYMVARWMGCEPGRVWELTRLWAPDGHRKNLLTEAIASAMRQFHQMQLADVVISYADPNAGHSGGVYKAASWVQLGRSEEIRTYRSATGQIVPRRKFHSGRNFIRKAEIIALGYCELKLPGKHRFARGLTRRGKQAVKRKALTLKAVLQ